MPAPPYIGVRHLRIKGDEGKAKQYLVEAQKVLGFVVQEAARNGLLTHKHVIVKPDGTRITGKLVGGEKIIEIEVGGGEEQPISRFLGEFVVWARDEAHPDGIDTDNPQQILVHKDSWKTLFFDSDIDGFATFPGRKGTFASVFPDGISHAGNVDWVGKRGQRVSWYGPSTRYFYDPHIKPESQYGKFVFLLGKTLLDVEQYITDSDEPEPLAEKFVMGAAFDGTHLFVVHADLPPGTTDTTPGPPNYADLTSPWPTGAVPLRLCKYTVVRDDAVTYHVVDGSREDLWSGSLNNAVQPWFFNASASVAVSVALPDVTMVRYRFENPGPTFPVEGFPSTSQFIHTLALDDFDDTWDVSSAEVTLGVAPSEATLAVDFIEDDVQELKIRRRNPYNPPLHDLQNEFALVMGGTEWVLAEGEFLGVIATRASYRVQERHVMYADLREKVMVMHHYQGTVRVNTFPIDRQEAVEVWRGGALIEEIIGDQIQQTGWVREVTYLPYFSDGISEILNLVVGVAVAPAFPLYQTFVCWKPQPHSHWLWQGGHGLNSYLAYPKEERFGVARTNAPGDVAVNRLDDYSDGLFDTDQLDKDEHYSVLGCATAEEVTLLSCYAYEYQTGKSMSFADDGTLADLTGIAGTNARYHPIWLLGQPPQEF